MKKQVRILIRDSLAADAKSVSPLIAFLPSIYKTTAWHACLPGNHLLPEQEAERALIQSGGLAP
jgi:hypothetical protein